MSTSPGAAFAAACLLSTLSLACADAEPPADQPLYQGKPLEGWVRQLKGDDALAREEAAAVLAAIGPAAGEALPTLKGMLKDPAASVRLRAAVAVWRVGRDAEAATPALAEALKGTRLGPRLTALRTLARMGPDAKGALPALLDVLNDPDDLVRQRTGYVLEDVGAPAVAALVERLHDKDPLVRRQIAGLLGQFGPAAKDAVPALKDALKDDDHKVRLAAAGALLRVDRLNPDAIAALVEAVQDADPEVRRQAGESLLQIRPRSKEAGPGYKALLKEGNDIRVRLDAAGALWDVDGDAKEVLPTLIEALKDADVNVRVRSLGVMARLGPDAKDALPDLKAALQTTPSYELGYVASLIGPAAAPPLLESMKAGGLQAGYALAGMGPDAAPALLKLLDDPDPNARGRAILWLGHIGPSAPAAVPALIEAAKDEKDPVRLQTLHALGNVGPTAKEAVPVLLAALQDKNANRRHAVLTSLQAFRIEPGPVPPVVEEVVKEEGPGLRPLAIEVRWHLDRKTGPAVEALASNKDDVTALIVLGHIAARDKEAIPALAERLKDPNLYLRSIALSALTQAGPNAKAAIPALTELLKSDEAMSRPAEARLLARVGGDPKLVLPVLTAELKVAGPGNLIGDLETLGEYGKEGAPAIPTIRDLLKSSNLSLRAAAAEALCRIDPARKAEAVESLLDVLSDPEFRAWRLTVAAGLCRVDPSNPKAVAALRAALADPQPVARTNALNACALAGPGAKELLPLLEQTLEDETDSLRLSAAMAVWKVGARPEKPVAAVVECLKGSPNTELRRQAAVRLGEMGPDALSAVPALREAMKDRALDVRRAAIDALRSVDAEAAAQAGIPDEPDRNFH